MLLSAASARLLGFVCWAILVGFLVVFTVVSKWSQVRRATLCKLRRHRPESTRVFTSLYAILLCRDCGHQMKYRPIRASDFGLGENDPSFTKPEQRS